MWIDVLSSGTAYPDVENEILSDQVEVPTYQVYGYCATPIFNNIIFLKLQHIRINFCN